MFSTCGPQLLADMLACHFSQDEARNTIHNLLGQLNFGSSEVCVRLNSIETGLAEDDLRATLTAKAFPHSIVLPKVETVEHLDWVKNHIPQVELNHKPFCQGYHVSSE